MDMACSKCGRVFAELQKCPNCNVPLTRDWSGKAAIIDPEKSRMAKEMDVQIKGTYALKI
jgi:DNA-directed RNA polymerase subunit E"